jgi:hypothetical protein
VNYVVAPLDLQHKETDPKISTAKKLKIPFIVDDGLRDIAARNQQQLILASQKNIEGIL